MEILPEFPGADCHSNVALQWNLLQDYEHKFEQLLEYQKLSKLCYDVSLKIVERGQFFITFAEEEGSDHMQNLCWGYTLLRDQEASRARVFLKDTKNRPLSWMQRSAFTKIVTVSKFRSNLCSETKQLVGFALWMELTNLWPKRQKPFLLETLSRGKLVAKLLPWPTVTLSPFSIPTCERKWTDINADRFNQDCLAVSKAMIRFLRHETFKILEKRWCSTIWRHLEWIQGKVQRCFGMVNWRLDIYSCTRRRSKEKFSIKLEP